MIHLWPRQGKNLSSWLEKKHTNFSIGTKQPIIFHALRTCSNLRLFVHHSSELYRLQHTSSKASDVEIRIFWSIIILFVSLKNITKISFVKVFLPDMEIKPHLINGWTKPFLKVLANFIKIAVKCIFIKLMVLTKNLMTSNNKWRRQKKIRSTLNS